MIKRLSRDLAEAIYYCKLQLDGIVCSRMNVSVDVHM